MTIPTTYRELLGYVAAQLPNDDTPDGPATQQALLVVVHAGAEREAGPAAADWDLFTAAVLQTLLDVRADLDNPVVLAVDLPAPGPDSPQLRADVTALVRQLADRYAAAAAGEIGSAWRRLVWASAAHRLDDAAAELR